MRLPETVEARHIKAGCCNISRIMHMTGPAVMKSMPMLVHLLCLLSVRVTVASSSCSHESTELINKLAPLVKPMLLEWEQISCIYNTGKGTKAVLTVRPRSTAQHTTAHFSAAQQSTGFLATMTAYTAGAPGRGRGCVMPAARHHAILGRLQGVLRGVEIACVLV